MSTRYSWRGRLSGILLAGGLVLHQVDAQSTPIHVTSGAASGDGTLADAILQANMISGPVEIIIDSNLQITPSAQMIIALNQANSGGLTITGNGATINMAQANLIPNTTQYAGDRAFFIASGNVNISNLSIVNGNAFGGQGMDNGGGGAGMGGAIFIANPSAILPQGAASSFLTLQTHVSLTNVSFSNNIAVGGNISNVTVVGMGGGGGMGGNGGVGVEHLHFWGPTTGGGGGGGFGVGSNGASAADDALEGGQGAFGISFSSGTSSAGAGGAGGSAGGTLGGGGGGGDPGELEPGAGGGGGIGGIAANGKDGGDGGFGGGGGGFAAAGPITGTAGNGGFGGGGGSNGNGGFGGGAGYLGSNGFGGGGDTSSSGASGGGGGAGLGGAIFVMEGATLTIVQNGAAPGSAQFSANSMLGGQPIGGGSTYGANGSAYGQDLFLGSDVTIDVTTVLGMNALGGSGNISDPNVTGHASDPNAVGGITKTGPGTLFLNGQSYYSGPTVIQNGTITLQGNPNPSLAATEMGTSSIIVGQSSGDVAKLILAGNNSLTLGGYFTASDAPIAIAQDLGSTGYLIIGDGAGTSGAELGARYISGGFGTASLVFAQEFTCGSTTEQNYVVESTLTGSLIVIQNGPGTTTLNPQYVADGESTAFNTYTGGTFVQQGTLIAGAPGALGRTAELQVDEGGTFVLEASDAVNDAASVTLNGGIFTISGTGLISETLGLLTIQTSSTLDLAGGELKLMLAGLTVEAGANWSIWNWNPNPAVDSVLVSGAVTGDLTHISFYSGSGTGYVGYGAIVNGALVAIPEPRATCIVIFILVAAILRRIRGPAT